MSGGASRCGDSGRIADLVQRIDGRPAELPAHLRAEVIGNLDESIIYRNPNRLQSKRLLATTGRVR